MAGRGRCKRRLGQATRTDDQTSTAPLGTSPQPLQATVCFFFFILTLFVVRPSTQGHVVGEAGCLKKASDPGSILKKWRSWRRMPGKETVTGKLASSTIGRREVDGWELGGSGSHVRSQQAVI